jgi:hypothetical protein
MANGDHLGPAFTAVAPDDEAALRALFVEQRARLDVVREHRLWDWVGGMPSFGFGSPKALLYGVYLQLACIAFVAIASIVAGFTHGPVLWVILGLVASCLVLRSAVFGRPMRRARRFYERAVQAPAMIVSTSPCSDPELQGVLRTTALVALGEWDGARLAALAAAAERLQRLISGDEPVPDELAALVANARAAMGEGRVAEGSRFAAPASLCARRCELAYFLMPAPLLPQSPVASRLLFVLCDPDSQAAYHTRVVQSSLWGNGVWRLCEAFPMRTFPMGTSA